MESLADDLTQMRRTPLSPDHVAAIREIATIRDYVPGQYVLPAGEALDRFVYVLEGEVEAVDPYTERRLMKGTIGPTQFVGDITFLSGARVTSGYLRLGGVAHDLPEGFAEPCGEKLALARMRMPSRSASYSLARV